MYRYYGQGKRIKDLSPLYERVSVANELSIEVINPLFVYLDPNNDTIFHSNYVFILT